MMDQYKEQYKKETEQIHAPADLIAKTKAAVREEEARMQRERAVQTVGFGMQVVPAVQRTVNRGATARKWAYPLTIVAAISILVSVSLMMRGLGKSSLDSAPYELASEMDSGGEEPASGAAFQEEASEAALVSEEAVEGETAGTTGLSEEVVEEETVDTAGLADETMRAAAADEAASESGAIEEAMSQKQGAFTESEAQTEEVMITEVWKKPAFADRAETESQTYENVVFQVTKENDDWIAYVENENGSGYVIRGEAETMDTFLETAYKKLLEIGY